MTKKMKLSKKEEEKFYKQLVKFRSKISGYPKWKENPETVGKMIAANIVLRNYAIRFFDICIASLSMQIGEIKAETGSKKKIRKKETTINKKD
jgi:hypothetical protein